MLHSKHARDVFRIFRFRFCWVSVRVGFVLPWVGWLGLARSRWASFGVARFGWLEVGMGGVCLVSFGCVGLGAD